MKSFKLLGTALVIALAPLNYAIAYEGFDAVCKANTERDFPEIENVTEACQCISGNASEKAINELQTATELGDLSEEAISVLKQCGYPLPSGN